MKIKVRYESGQEPYYNEAEFDLSEDYDTFKFKNPDGSTIIIKKVPMEV